MSQFPAKNSDAPSDPPDKLDPEDLLGRIAEEFFTELARGTAPATEDYAQRYPELGDVIRDTFPRLAAFHAEESNREAKRQNSETSARLLAGRHLGDFRLLREIGRGGMGIVFEAEQTTTGQIVAVKVLPFSASLDGQAIDRFRNEARVMTALRHPNIVRVHTIGEDQGAAYFSMDLVRGHNLSDLVAMWRQSNDETAPDRQDSPPRPQDLREMVRWGAVVARALQHAHRHGVIHRDIKPANLMLDPMRHVWITDFGLAQLEGSVPLTVTGSLVGTLRYMSPEQVRGGTARVDHRTDIYSLGITLYELTTFRPAFSATDRSILLRQILNIDPPRPSSFHRTFPRDLETVLCKAIAKRSEDRYPTAEAFAEDLENFVERRPVRARRPSAVDHVARWISLYPRAATATVLVMFVGLLILSAFLISIERLNSDLRVATQQAENRRVQIESSRNREAILRDEALEAEAVNDALHYAADIRLAASDFRGEINGHSKERLARYIPTDGEPDRRHFAWHYLWNELHLEDRSIPTESPIYCLRCAPDGSRFALAGENGQVVIRDVESGKVTEELGALGDSVFGLAYSRDGRRLAAAADGGHIAVWDLPSRRRLGTLNAPDTSCRSLEFSPTDGRLFAGCGDFVEIWTQLEGPPQERFGRHPDSVNDLAVSQDGRYLAVATGNDHAVPAGVVTVWPLGATQGPRQPIRFSHESRCTAVRFSHDGAKLAVGTQSGVLIVWNLSNTVEPIARSVAHTSNILRITFSPNDKYAVTASKDSTVRLWETRGWTMLRSLRSHIGRAHAAEWTPDGNRVITAARDGEIKYWDPFRHSYQQRVLQQPSAFLVHGNKSLDQLLVASTNHWPRLHQLDQRSSKPLPYFPVSGGAHRGEALLGITSGEVGFVTDQGHGTLAPIGTAGHRADIDGDGDIDYFAGFGRQSRLLWQENIGGVLSGPLRMSSRDPNLFDSQFFVDFNGDGTQDIVTCQRGRISWRDSHFPEAEAREPIFSLESVCGIELADLDRDRLPDLLVASQVTDDLRCYRHVVRNGEQGFDAQPSWTIELAAPNAIAVHDLDGDGFDDVFVAGSRELVHLHQVRVDRGDECPIRIVQRIPIEGLDIRALHVADTNGDGLPDLLGANIEGVLCFLRQSNGRFAADAICLTRLQGVPWTTPSRANVVLLDSGTNSPLGYYQGHSDAVDTIALQPAGGEFATVGIDWVIRFWRNDGRAVAVIPTGSTKVNRLAYSPSGDVLAAAVGDDLWILDSLSHQVLHRCRGHENTINSLEFSPDGQVVATTSDDLSIRLWDAKSGRSRSTLLGHDSKPLATAFSADQALLASGDLRGCVRIWDVATGEQLLDLHDFPYHVRFLAFANASRLIAVGSDQGADHVSTAVHLGEWSLNP